MADGVDMNLVPGASSGAAHVPVYRIESIERVCAKGVATSETRLMVRVMMTPKQGVDHDKAKQQDQMETFDDKELIWENERETLILRPNAFELCKVFSRDRYLECVGSGSQSAHAHAHDSSRSRTYFVAHSKGKPNRIDGRIKQMLSITSFEEDARRPTQVCYTVEKESQLAPFPLIGTDTHEQHQSELIGVPRETVLMTYDGHTYSKNGFALFATFDGERVAQITGFGLSAGGRGFLSVNWLCHPSHPSFNGRYDFLLPCDSSCRVMSLSGLKGLDTLRTRTMPSRPCRVIRKQEWNRRKAKGENMRDVFCWSTAEPHLIAQNEQPSENLPTSGSTNNANVQSDLAPDSNAGDLLLSGDDRAVVDADMPGEVVNADRSGSCTALTLDNGDVIRVGEFYRSTRMDFHHRYRTTVVLIDAIYPCIAGSLVRFIQLLNPSSAGVSDSIDSFHPGEFLWTQQSTTELVSCGSFDSGRILEPCRVMARDEYFNAIKADDHTTPIYFATRTWNTKERKCTDIDDEQANMKPSQPLLSISSPPTGGDSSNAAAAAATVSSARVDVSPSTSMSLVGDTAITTADIRVKVEPDDSSISVYPVPPGDHTITDSHWHSRYQQIQIEFNRLQRQHIDLQEKYRHIVEAHRRCHTASHVHVHDASHAISSDCAALRSDVMVLADAIDKRGREERNTASSSLAAESSPSIDHQPHDVEMTFALSSHSSSASLKRKADSDLPDQEIRDAAAAARRTLL